MARIGRPPKYCNCMDLQAMCELYFETCEEGRIIEKFTVKSGVVTYTELIPPSKPGLAYFLGYQDRHSISDIINRNDNKEGFAPVLKRAIAYIEAEKLAGAQTGRLNPIAVIFDLKNNHDYKDVQTVENIDNVPRLPEGIEEQDLEQIVREVLNRSKPAEVAHLAVAGKAGK